MLQSHISPSAIYMTGTINNLQDILATKNNKPHSHTLNLSSVFQLMPHPFLQCPSGFMDKALSSGWGFKSHLGHTACYPVNACDVVVLAKPLGIPQLLLCSR